MLLHLLIAMVALSIAIEVGWPRAAPLHRPWMGDPVNSRVVGPGSGSASGPVGDPVGEAAGGSASSPVGGSARDPLSRKEIPLTLAGHLMVTLLQSGLPADLVLQRLQHHLDDINVALPADIDEITSLLAMAQRTGIAPAALVTDACERRRCETLTRARLAAHRLGVWVTLPMGLCFLPAFVFLTVVPLVLAMFTAA